jgi:hypothetical protein
VRSGLRSLLASELARYMDVPRTVIIAIMRIEGGLVITIAMFFILMIFVLKLLEIMLPHSSSSGRLRNMLSGRSAAGASVVLRMR